jgi:chemotaxis protein methyltransferase CheR
LKKMVEDVFQPQELQWSRFYRHMHLVSGIDLDLYKPEQLQRRILAMARDRKAGTLDEFWEMIADKPDGVRWFTDKLAINVSEMYRNPVKWEELKDRVLPHLLENSPNLRCWSAGCSFGAEAHTLAVILDVHFPGEHTILGTDIDASSLKQARRGEFTETEMRSVPPEVRKTYFELDPNSWNWIARPSLKRYLTFEEHNLLCDRFETGYDLILCRNVVIYLTEYAKADLFKRFFQSLKPGGVLFLGSTERIHSPHEIGFTSHLPMFYRKPLEPALAAA